MQEHWQRVHTADPPDRTGWWEPVPETSLALVERCGLAPDDLIVDAGSGASTFIDALLERGYANLVAVDISATALLAVRFGLSDEASGHVRCMVDDLAHPLSVLTLHDVALWHDRAALHFLTGPADRERYADAVRRVVRPGGFVILAEFALDGAQECSGLPVRRYDAAMLAALLGPDFTLLDEVRQVYINIDGEERPYIYARFQRTGG